MHIYLKFIFWSSNCNEVWFKKLDSWKSTFSTNPPHPKLLLPTGRLHDNGTGPDLSRSSFYFLVLHYNFLFVPCGGLSWLPVSFLLHVKYTLSYRIVSYRMKTGRSHFMPRQQHLSNGLARPADYSVFERKWTFPPACLATATVAGLWPAFTPCGRADVGTGQTSGRTTVWTRWKHNAPAAGCAAGA